MEVKDKSTGGCYTTNKVNKIVSKALVYMDAEIVLGCSNLEKTAFFHFNLDVMKESRNKSP